MKQTRGLGSTQRRNEARRFLADEARAQQNREENEQLWEEHHQHLGVIAQTEENMEEATQRYMTATQSLRDRQSNESFHMMAEERCTTRP